MPSWADYILKAWNALTNDRARYEMGGCSGIWYASISAYARDHGLSGDGFSDFELFFKAMDDEYVSYTAEKAKEAADKAKQDQERPK